MTAINRFHMAAQRTPDLSADRHAARTLEIDPDKAGRTVITYPYAEVTYVRGTGPTADLRFETIAALSADVPPDATGIRVPAGCKPYATKVKGLRATVTVRPLTAGGLPHIPGATVTGLRTTMDFGAHGRTDIDTVSIRSASRLILVAVGGKGDMTAQTEKTATTASAYAHDRLGTA